MLNFLPGIRTGKIYAPHLEGGTHNEDMAVAIVDEIENRKLAFKHWSCTGTVGLKER